MKKLLVIESSLNAEQGNSSKLAERYINVVKQHHDVDVTLRNIAQQALPHLTQEEMVAWSTPATERTAEQNELAKLSDDIVADVQNADEIVLAIPMYNFGIPSVLKAWFDRLARAGVTFKYTETGPQGLLTDKSIKVMAARGGKYAGTALDNQSAYVSNFLNFLGLTDISFVYAEGLAMGEEQAKESWEEADKKIAELFGQ